MTVANLADLVEMYAGRGGVKGDAINRNLIIDLVNLKLVEVYALDGSTTTYEGATVEDQGEYDLPVGAVPLKVVYDGVVIERMGYTEALDLKYSEENA